VHQVLHHHAPNIQYPNTVDDRIGTNQHGRGVNNRRVNSHRRDVQREKLLEEEQ
jgi:hypothetical protein